MAPDAVDDEVAELLAGQVKRRKQVRFGTTRKNARTVIVHGQIEDEKLKLLVSPRVGGPVAAGRLACSLEIINPLPHLEHLFQGFTTPRARTQVFRKVIEDYVKSEFPYRFGFIENEDLRQRIERRLLLSALQRNAPGLALEAPEPKSGHESLVHNAVPPSKVTDTITKSLAERDVQPQLKSNPQKKQPPTSRKDRAQKQIEKQELPNSLFPHPPKSGKASATVKSVSHDSKDLLDKIPKSSHVDYDDRSDHDSTDSGGMFVTAKSSIFPRENPSLKKKRPLMESDESEGDLMSGEKVARKNGAAVQVPSAHFEDAEQRFLWVGGFRLKRSKTEAFKDGWLYVMNDENTVERGGRKFLECKYVYEIGEETEPFLPLDDIEGMPPIDHTHSIPGVPTYFLVSKTPIQIHRVHYVLLHLFWRPWDT